MTIPTRFRYFEDVEIGEEHKSMGRTVTEADIANFAGVSSDFASIHMDEEFAKKTIFGGRIAHGLLGLALTDGLKNRTPFSYEVHGMASLGWTWDFRGPIRPGDTVTATFRVANKREASKADRGVITLEVHLRNQRGEVVQEGEHRWLVQRRPQ